MRIGSKNKNLSLFLILIANFIVLFALYIVGMQLNATLTFIVYTVTFAGFVFAYVIYNRGFSRTKVTKDMLPAEWSEEKKKGFIEDGKMRIQKSKWMLTVIVPLIAIYGYEVLDIYVVPFVKNIVGL